MKKLEEDAGYIQRSVVASNCSRGVTARQNLSMVIWDLARGRKIGYFSPFFSAGSRDDISICAIDPTGTRIAIGSAEEDIYLLKFENYAPVPIITGWQWSADNSYAFGCPHLGSEITCPKCGKPVKLNPFTINAD